MAPLALPLACLALLASPAAAEQSHAHANPIRKVVTLLQQMQEKVEAEGEKEKELFDKFMCYCKSGSGALEASIAEATDKLPQLASDIKKDEEMLAQVEEDLATAQADKASAKTAIAEATGIREKEAAAFASEKAEYEANIAAIGKAVAALEKGMAGAFLQTSGVQALQKLAQDSKKLFDDDRDKILSFLSGQEDSEYAPSSGEVTGILKTMGDEMSAGLKEASAAEAAAISAYEELVASKNKELSALQKSIEEKLKKEGDLSIAIAQMKNDLGDTEEALIADKQFLAELDETCKAKQAEWAVIVKTRGEELEALADTIKLLNDDDALELFKKTLPSASASFLQVQVSTAAVRARALALIKGARHGPHRARVDLIALALRGKKAGFEKVIGMIDDMVAALKAEQADDEAKKEYCDKEFDVADDSKKSLEKSVADETKAIATTEDGIATVKDEIAALEAGIKALDKSVAEATEQRKEENTDFKELMASDSAAKELIGIAKNRLNKFYNPKLYKAAPKRELSAEDRVVVNMGGTVAPTNPPGGISGTGITAFAQVSSHTQHKHKVAPPPPPAAFGAYTKKSEESGGVMAMMDMLVADLDKEMTESKAEEKDAQADYEAMMKDSSAKRAADSKLLTEKESTKAELEEALESHNEAKADFSKELAATMEYINSLHLECDWLLKYFDVRKEARASEVDALGKAKAVLSGADYSLVQTGARRYLRRAH
jgi:septal ring factor EnvC (AmiA/AmiB activator)